MSALYDAILAAVPGTMQELAARTGVVGQPLWDAVHTMRRAGMLIRRGPSKARLFQLPDAPAAAPSDQAAAPHDAEPEPPAEKKERKRPVILFWLPGWPNQEPGRRMVWGICWKSKAWAESELKRLKRLLGHEAEWELVGMTPGQARKLRQKGFDLKEQRDRERAMRERADAPS